MDTLTHALSGALLARATEPTAAGVLPRQTRMAAGFWAGAFPDSDILARLVDPLMYITTHRGITHSVVMLPIWAVGLALLFQLLYRGRYPWRAFFGVCALGIGIHIAGDVITSFGTMIFAPLSAWRAAAALTFIIDPYFTAIIVAGLLASLQWHRARIPAVVALAVLAAYVGLQGALHYRAWAIGNAYIGTNRLTQARAYALPQPFSPFNWLIVVAQPQRYRLSYVSLTRRNVHVAPPDAGMLRRAYDSYRPLDQALWRTVPRYGERAQDIVVAKALWGSAAFAPYRHFAMFPAIYRIDRFAGKTCARFTDLRFALVGRRSPFRYSACREDLSQDWKLEFTDPDRPGAQPRGATRRR